MLPAPTIPIRTRLVAISLLSHSGRKLCSAEGLAHLRWSDADRPDRPHNCPPPVAARELRAPACRRGDRRGAGLPRGFRNRRPSLGDLFFQAEDGIRDLTVTGVQTCALPI